jgi:hypothetical protein
MNNKLFKKGIVAIYLAIYAVVSSIPVLAATTVQVVVQAAGGGVPAGKGLGGLGGGGWWRVSI